MNIYKTTRRIALPLAVLTLTGALAAAPTDPKATRQASFKKMGAAMKVMKEQLAGGSPAKPAMLAAAQTVAATARQQGALFPAGSGAGTDALPTIWTQKATFDAQMAKLVAESGKLVTVVNGGNVDAIGAQFKVVGGTCAGCHKQFRADN
ncbi:MAG: cytochrome c [Sphingobium sp.]|uniref:c-type cytochrome n=1 Tax=Sphingobium sp. TaxID=1912891 RepID=UPI002E22F0C3